MASGLSERFGEADKLLYPFGGRPLASYTISLAVSLGEFSRVILVAANPLVAELAEGFGVSVIWNANPKRGQCESIRLGAASSSADQYFFFPCDQPLLDARTARMLMARAGHGRIVEPTAGGRPSSPVIFSSEFRGELLSIPDGESGRSVIRMHPDRVAHVEVPDGLALADIDTLSELEFAEALAGRRKGGGR
jgi:molybdenum cofactor cytidylyltransferase